MTEGKTGDVKAARTWTFPAGSVVVADRAYLDFKWFHQLQARGVTFVTRLKRGVRYRVTREHIRPGTGVLSDQTIELTSARSRKAYAAPLRRVAYQGDEEPLCVRDQQHNVGGPDDCGYIQSGRVRRRRRGDLGSVVPHDVPVLRHVRALLLHLLVGRAVPGCDLGPQVVHVLARDHSASGPPRGPHDGQDDGGGCDPSLSILSVHAVRLPVQATA